MTSNDRKSLAFVVSAVIVVGLLFILAVSNRESTETVANTTVTATVTATITAPPKPQPVPAPVFITPAPVTVTAAPVTTEVTVGVEAPYSPWEPLREEPLPLPDYTPPAFDEIEEPFEYISCADAWDAGDYSMTEQDNGYGKHLDRDGDGLACEPNE